MCQVMGCRSYLRLTCLPCIVLVCVWHRYAACRCYYVAEYYAAVKQWDNSMALLEHHATGLCDTAEFADRQAQKSDGVKLYRKHADLANLSRYACSHAAIV